VPTDAGSTPSATAARASTTADGVQPSRVKTPAGSARNQRDHGRPSVPCTVNECSARYVRNQGALPGSSGRAEMPVTTSRR